MKRCQLPLGRKLTVEGAGDSDAVLDDDLGVGVFVTVAVCVGVAAAGGLGVCVGVGVFVGIGVTVGVEPMVKV